MNAADLGVPVPGKVVEELQILELFQEMEVAAAAAAAVVVTIPTGQHKCENSGHRRHGPSPAHRQSYLMHQPGEQVEVACNSKEDHQLDLQLLEQITDARTSSFISSLGTISTRKSNMLVLVIAAPIAGGVVAIAAVILGVYAYKQAGVVPAEVTVQRRLLAE
ncbi:hypothetical protein V6N11_060993 [Hibiscus sabdariffa]|uniref:Uncharacterized protein n=1 Tax=Hibiscus sabdariffa TaxID=183260 RepID=A0ABR2QS82_9ROSI